MARGVYFSLYFSFLVFPGLSIHQPLFHYKLPKKDAMLGCKSAFPVVFKAGQVGWGGWENVSGGAPPGRITLQNVR